MPGVKGKKKKKSSPVLRCWSREGKEDTGHSSLKFIFTLFKGHTPVLQLGNNEANVADLGFASPLTHENLMKHLGLLLPESMG